MVLLEDHICGLVVCLEVTADIRHDEASMGNRLLNTVARGAQMWQGFR